MEMNEVADAFFELILFILAELGSFIYIPSFKGYSWSLFCTWTYQAPRAHHEARCRSSDHHIILQPRASPRLPVS